MRDVKNSKQIANDYTGKDLVVGSEGPTHFMRTWRRLFEFRAVDFDVTSCGQSKTSGKVKVITELTEDIKGKDVLLIRYRRLQVDVRYLIKTLTNKAEVIKITTDKPERR